MAAHSFRNEFLATSLSTVNSNFSIEVVVAGLVERPSGECVSEPQCPHPCRCADGIVDCQEKALTKVPDHLPEATTEL